MDYSVLISLILLCSLGGFLSGLLGIGGGVIFVPILIYTFESMGMSGSDFSNFTRANSFGIIMFASAAATLKHIRSKNIEFRYLLYVGLAGVLTTMAIAQIEHLSKQYFLILFLIIVIMSLMRMLLGKSKEGDKKLSSITWWIYAIIGGVTGIISGLTAVGGGIIMVPAFTNLLKLPIKVSTGLSSGAIFVFAFANFLLYGFASPIDKIEPYQWGFMKFDVLVFPILSVLIFAPLGVVIGQKLSNKVLKGIFMALLLVVIVKTIYSLLYGL